MTEWLLVSPLLTLLVGACASMISHTIYPPKAGEISIRIAAFSILVAALQLSVLGYRAYGLSPSGLFRIDGLSISFSLMACLFFLMAAVGLWLEKNKAWPMTATALLLLATMTLAGLFSNDGLLLFLSLGTLLMFSRWSSSIWSVRVEARSEKTGIIGILGWFVFSGFSLVLLVQTTGSGRYEVIEKAMSTFVQNSGFHLGYFGLLIVMATGFMPAPLDSYAHQGEKLGHWSGAIIAKLVVPLAFMLLAIRWMWIFGFDSNLEPRTQIDLSLVMGLGLTLILANGIWTLISKQTLLRVLSQLSIQSVALGFVPFFLKNNELIKIGLSHICLSAIISVLCMAALAEIKLSTKVLLSGLREAVQNASIRVQIMISFSMIAMVLPFTMPARLLLHAIWEAAFRGSGMTSIFCALILIFMAGNMLLMSLRVVQTFAVDAERNLKWDGGSVAQKIWAYSLFVLVLVLGVYPTPLYNYFAHSIKLFLKAN